MMRCDKFLAVPQLNLYSPSLESGEFAVVPAHLDKVRLIIAVGAERHRRMKLGRLNIVVGFVQDQPPVLLDPHD